MNKGLWMSKDGGCLIDGDISYDGVPRVEPKRSHQWFMDGEAALFPSKKQAVEVSCSDSFGGLPVSGLPPWGSVPGFNSVSSQLTEQLYDTDAGRDTDFDEGNVPSVNVGSLQMGRQVIDDSFQSNALFGLSMSRSLEDPKSGINYGGIRKVKVSEVRDPENFISISAGPSYSGEANEGISVAHGYGKVDESSISMGLSYGQEEVNDVPLGDSYGRENDNYVSMGQSYTKDAYSKDACNTLALRNPYKADSSTMQMANSLNGEDCNIMRMAGNFSKGNGSDVISLSHMYKGDRSIAMTPVYNKRDNLTTATPPSNSICENHGPAMDHSFNKGAGSIISFGGYNDDDADAPGRLMCNYDLLIGQPSVQRCNTSNQKDLTVSNGNVAIVSTPGVESATKKKEDIKSTKKTPPNNFPSNVRSLLSTGILDEVPVKYIAWSREKELRGIIKGSGYLCGCQPCNFSKAINAFEFERHAGCKTKHPNNHIYFENGKTIYGIVQELRNTPQNMLFDVIQTITGSPINQKSFRLWKESFLAATRELQRIYGKDERNQPF